MPYDYSKVFKSNFVPKISGLKRRLNGAAEPLMMSDIKEKVKALANQTGLIYVGSYSVDGEKTSTNMRFDIPGDPEFQLSVFIVIDTGLPGRTGMQVTMMRYREDRDLNVKDVTMGDLIKSLRNLGKPLEAIASRLGMTVPELERFIGTSGRS